jgi:glutamate formiminotransferase
MNIIDNLKHAIHNNETVTIGGGSFDKNELQEVLTYLVESDKALKAARLLCANLRHGGIGHKTLVDAFHDADANVP